MNRALRVSSESGLVSVLDIPPLHQHKNKLGYARIVIESFSQKDRFLVEYRVVANTTDRFVQYVLRILPDAYRLSYSNRYATSYYATPELCEALDFRLEALSLSKSLLRNRQDVKKALDDVFRIKTSVFAWCLDQVEAAQRLMVSDEQSDCVSFDFHSL